MTRPPGPPRPGYLVVRAEEGRAYLGGLMVTDERGLPVDRFERATATLDEIFVTVVKGDGNHVEQ